MNIVAIVQARLGSSRLPMKSLLCLRGSPIIDWVTDRLCRSQSLSRVIVAVPDTPLDVILQQHLLRRNIDFFAGSENDVLDRFCQAAAYANADIIVRVCADNPLVWAYAIDSLVNFYLNSKCDYAWNHIPRNNLWPDGLGAEIVSREVLTKIDHLAQLPAQREHCFNYIWDNPQDFSMATFNPEPVWLQRPDIKLDIDSSADFLRLALLPIQPASSGREIIEAWDENK